MLASPRRTKIEEDDSDALDPADLARFEQAAAPVHLVVPPGGGGERLDKALARLMPEVSRSRIKEWIEQGAVRLNGKTPTPRQTTIAGDAIDVIPPLSPEANAFQPEPMALDVVHADETIIVLDKPAGLVVHPATGNWSGTLLNGLLAYDPRLARLPRAGIVHRLDGETSGLMVVARTAAAQINLVRQLQARTVTREYWAVVHGGAEKAGVVDAAIARDPRQPLRFKTTTAPHGKSARTLFRRIATADSSGRTFTWLACRLETGRTHQIRVHLESIGLPLVGDPVYRRGRPSIARSETSLWARFDRQALHACRLGLVHPATGEPVHWFKEPPQDMQQLMLSIGFDLHRRTEVFK